MGQESRDFPSRGSAWDKNRVIFLPAAPRGARIAPRYLAAERFGPGNSVSSLPPSSLGQETVFLACRRTVWSKKRVFFLSRRLGETRIARDIFPPLCVGQDSRDNSFPRHVFREFDENL